MTITLSLDAEGGYGCSLDWDGMDSACTRQEDCPYVHREGCLLAPLTP